MVVKVLDLPIVTDFRILSSPEYERMAFGMSSVCLSVCPLRICALLAPEQLNGSYSCKVIKNLSIPCRLPVLQK